MENTYFEFIKSNITISPTGCWEWNKSLNSSGYGQFTKDGVYYTTHRYVCSIFHGTRGNEFQARHLCHNRKCCNPDHLTWGTPKENYADSLEAHKERASKLRCKWFIGGETFDTVREASKKLQIHQATIIRHTDKDTRIFDLESYRKACYQARIKPKL